MGTLRTKEEIVKDNNDLTARIGKLINRENELRERFTDILGHMREISSSWGTPKREILTWEEIFFKIGELNSDANYSIILEEKFRLQAENEKLKNPPKKETV